MDNKTKVRVALFASGSGSNAENIIEYFKNHSRIDITHIFCNKPDAYVLQRAARLGVGTTVFDRDQFYKTNFVLHQLKRLEIDFIVLAGFLWLIPATLVSNYKGKMINIHPALLPAHGGRGMYGSKVHQAVLEAGDKETGITIHFVNEHYDEGDIIFQASIPVDKTDNADTVASKVHGLEYQFFPSVIEKTINNIFGE